MNEQEINNLINDFTSETDKRDELEKDINIFAGQLAEKLLLELDKEGMLAEFYGTNFSFKFLTHTNRLMDKMRFEVKLLDLDNYRKCLKLGIPDKVNIGKVIFEHEGQYKLQDELKNVLVLLLFDHYDFPIRPNEEDDGTVQIRQ